MWPTTSPNRLIFTKRSEKYALFRTTTSLLVSLFLINITKKYISILGKRGNNDSL